MSTVGYDNVGVAEFPMPALWRDCPKSRLNDEFKGYYFFERFSAFTPLTTTVLSGTVSDHIRYRGDLDTELAIIDDFRYGGVRMETDATAADAGSLVTSPLGSIVRNSGKKMWFEARVAPGDVDDDMGTFVGLVELDGANHDVIADDPATDASVADQSLIGFFQNNANPDAYNIIYRKAGSAPVTVATDVTNSGKIPVEERSSLTDGGFHRLGIRFDGRETVEFYVNGYRVATLDVTSLVDQSQDYCGIVAVKTGDGAAELLDTAYMAAAFLDCP